MIISLMRSLGSTAWETATNNRVTNYVKNNPGTTLKVGILGLSVLGGGYAAHKYLTPKILELMEKYPLETITQKEICPPCELGKDLNSFSYLYWTKEKPMPNTCEPCTIEEETRTLTELGKTMPGKIILSIQKNSAMIGAISAIAATSGILARLFLAPEKPSGKSN